MKTKMLSKLSTKTTSTLIVFVFNIGGKTEKSNKRPLSKTK